MDPEPEWRFEFPSGLFDSHRAPDGSIAAALAWLKDRLGWAHVPTTLPSVAALTPLGSKARRAALTAAVTSPGREKWQSSRCRADARSAVAAASLGVRCPCPSSCSGVASR